MNRTRTLVTLTALLGLAATGAAGPAAAATAAPVCEVDANDFGTGYQVIADVENPTAVPLSGWTLTFTLPVASTVETRFNGVVTRSGTSGTSTPFRWYDPLQPGRSVSLGFGGRGAAPSNFALNGAPCIAI